MAKQPLSEELLSSLTSTKHTGTAAYLAELCLPEFVLTFKIGSEYQSS